MKQIPNLFTLLNLVFGCIAIILILQTGETLVESDEGSWIARLPENIWWGAIFIGIAGIIDFLDGFVARLFKATSAMGGQLDSLADVVSFGVAPGMILYQLLRISWIKEDAGLDASVWVLAPALLFPCAGCWRLARFNIENSGSSDFKGLPIPAAGIVVASLPLILFYNNFDIATVLLNKWLLYAIILLLSWLMISNTRFMAMKFSDFTIKNNLPRLVLVIAGIIAAIFLQWLAIPLIFILYLIISLTSKKQLK